MDENVRSFRSVCTEAYLLLVQRALYCSQSSSLDFAVTTATRCDTVPPEAHLTTQRTATLVFRKNRTRPLGLLLLLPGPYGPAGALFYWLDSRICSDDSHAL